MTSQLSPTQELMALYYQPIAPLLKEEGVTNIYVNRYDEVLYEKFGQIIAWDKGWDNEYTLQEAIKMLANSLEQPIQEDEPLLDAVMPDGSRLNAGLPPVLSHAYITIRVFPEKSIDAEKLIKWGSMTPLMYQYLLLSVLTKRNVVVSGGTGSGKTTLIQMLMEHIPDDRRLVVIEDTKELKTRRHNCLQLEAPKRRNANGKQIITLGRLVINALRQTPESLVVGEMRDTEAATAYRTLLNTGHSGVITTIHADSAELTISRLSDLVQESNPGIPREIIEKGFLNSLGLIVYAENTLNNGKRITAIADLIDGEVQRVFEWDFINEKHIVHDDRMARSSIWDEARRFKFDLSWMDDFFQVYIKD